MRFNFYFFLYYFFLFFNKEFFFFFYFIFFFFFFFLKKKKKGFSSEKGKKRGRWKEQTPELKSRGNLECCLLFEKKNISKVVRQKHCSYFIITHHRCYLIVYRLYNNNTTKYYLFSITNDHTNYIQ